jgi:hypothetical protein
MAFPTIDNSTLISHSDLPSGLGYGAVQNIHFSKAITTAMLASGYVTAIALMPANTRYLGILYAKATDLDTNGSPALALDLGVAGVSVTTYDDVDCFLDGSTIGQAGTLTSAILFAGAGLLVPVPHYLTLTAATAAGTAAAGTFTLGMAVELGASA